MPLATESRTLCASDVLGHIDQVVFETDPAGFWRFLSPAWERLTGYAVEESLGTSYSMVLAAEAGAPAGSQFQKLLSGRAKAVCLEAGLVKRTGKYCRVEVVARPVIGAGGQIEGFAGTLREVAWRKQMDRLLKAARSRADRASRSKSRFVAEISRELRAPLRDLLALGKAVLGSTVDEQHHQNVLKMCDSGHDILSVVNNLHDLSRLDAGLLKLAPRPMDLRLASEDVVEIYTRKADRKRIDLALQLAGDLPKRLVMDAARYRQLLSLFVENAIAATSTGHVLISVTSESVPDPDTGVLICIEDTGAGMSREQVAAFTLQYTEQLSVDNSPGLGLALAHRLLELMGGQFSIDSELGRGTRITLRLKFPCDPNAWRVAPVPSRLAGRRVLIGDQSPVIRGAIKSLLANSGIDIVEASTPEMVMDALTGVQGAAPGTVLLSTELAKEVTSSSGWQSGAIRTTMFALLCRSTEMPGPADVQAAGFAAVLRRNLRRGELVSFLEEVSGAAAPNSSRQVRKPAPIGCIHREEGLWALVVTEGYKQLLPIAAILDGISCNYSPALSMESALTCVSGQHYHIVLIDDDLAGADPFELAEQICARQAQKPAAIVVLTSEAKAAQKRLSSNYDVTDLLQKPVDAAGLLNILATVGERACDALAVFDYDTALSRCGGDTTLLAEIAREFNVAIVPQIDALTYLVFSRNPGEATKIGRQITVAAQLVAAPRLTEQILKLQEHIALYEWAEAADAVAIVKREAGNVASRLPSAPVPANFELAIPSATQGAGKVMAVQADSLSRHFFQRVLDKAGYQVTLLSAAAEAKAELLRPSSAKMCCLFVDLAIADSLDFLDWVVSHDDCLTIVAIVSGSDAHLVPKVMRAGASVVLNKPVDRAALEAAASEAAEITYQKRRNAEMRLDIEQLGAAQRSLIEASIGPASSGVGLYLHPKHEAGGDFFSYFRLSEPRSAAVITDVSGHDLKSAFVSAHFQGMVRALLESNTSLEAVFSRANAFLLNEWTSAQTVGVSVSAGSVVVDRAAGQIEVVRCGTPPPVFTAQNGECKTLAGGASYPLGWFDDCELERAVLTASSGFVTMWTDGVEDLAGELNVSSCALATALLNSRTSGDLPAGLKHAKDDMLVASIDIAKEDASGSGNEFAFQPVLNETYASADLAQIDVLQRLWGNSMLLAIAGLPQTVLHDVLLCAREGVINALHYGCASGGLAALRLTNCPHRRHLVLQIEDPGPGHDFDHTQHEVSAADELIPEHRGLILMAALSTSFTAERRGARITMEFINKEK